MKSSILFVFLVLTAYSSDSFKEEQLRYSRVRQAFADKEANMLSLLEEKKIDRNAVNVYIRAFKSEKQIELWAKNESDEKYQLIKVYDVCRTSGEIGPKRQQGDLQIPEGFYHINIFNPYSNFYLSLGINYPNSSDRILGVKGNLGGDIFIHGDCVTIGCLPITDDEIKELYIFSVEARNNGQEKIPVAIYPSRLTDKEFNRLLEQYASNTELIQVWTDLKAGFDLFNETKDPPSIGFLPTGRYEIK